MAKIIDTFKRLRLAVFLVWGAILLALVGLSFLSRLAFWALLFYLVFPIILLFYVVVLICVGTLIGDRLNAKNPPSCENCIWKDARNIAGHCLGEIQGNKFGEVCDAYKRDNAE